MIPFLELKTTYEKVTRAINMNHEPSQELLHIADHLKALCQDDGAILENVLEEEPPLDNLPDKPYLTQAHLRYIFEDLAPGIVKKMARERSQSDSYLDCCREILESLILFSIPVI